MIKLEQNQFYNIFPLLLCFRVIEQIFMNLEALKHIGIVQMVRAHRMVPRYPGGSEKVNEMSQALGTGG